MGDTRVAHAADDLIGQVIESRYRVTQLVATGGMARVYRAVDTRLDRQVALKIGLPARAVNPGFADLFQREAKTVARLSHPHVVAVFDQGNHDGLPFVVMEFVNGPTLRELLGTRRPPVSWSLRLCRQVLSGVAAAHRIGFVHRDIKPENILLDAGKYAKVADFGLAKAAHPSVTVSPGRRSPLLATVAYIPPELVTTGSADPRSDVYAAGIVLYEMLTGDVPFDGPDPNKVAYMHVDNDVPAPALRLPQLPPAVNSLVVRATRRSPEARFSDAAAFAAAIDEVMDARRTRPVPRHATPAARRPARGRTRPTAAAKLLLTTAAILLVGLGGWLLAVGLG
ncbi:protein kinase domain-containing protein [Stackebrandtia nassauensis]|uniref:Serine/threonine protein kinase n=1 Tax=Stackebrandtia nassauensis (strain DSM 44728 / CIP 108903 / NRRL B-16338 / NBRC 102104 / LLR-40K-21) TaxID=446470 RepID=D3Q9X2_STANL|nr:protein kinase [Stackebrandtia nassauensis]ADD44668.1 serine/threonine protein kinase [Stackebrandtia nassauensis DSM 44728]